MISNFEAHRLILRNNAVLNIKATTLLLILAILDRSNVERDGVFRAWISTKQLRNTLNIASGTAFNLVSALKKDDSPIEVISGKEGGCNVSNVYILKQSFVDTLIGLSEGKDMASYPISDNEFTDSTPISDSGKKLSVNEKKLSLNEKKLSVSENKESFKESTKESFKETSSEDEITFDESKKILEELGFLDGLHKYHSYDAAVACHLWINSNSGFVFRKRADSEDTFKAIGYINSDSFAAKSSIESYRATCEKTLLEINSAKLDHDSNYELLTLANCPY